MLTFGMAMLVVLSLAACNVSSSSGNNNETTPPSASQSDATKKVTESQENSPAQGGATVGSADSAAEPELPNVRDKSTEQNADLKSAPVQTEPPTDEPVLSQPSEPTEVLKIYENYEQAIENNNFNFILGPIEKSTMDTSEFYSFDLYGR